MNGNEDTLGRLLRIDDATALPGQPDGVQAALAFSAETWRESALAAAKALAATGKPFTVADLHALGLAEPDRPQRWGAVFAAIRTHGIARVIGWTAHRTAGGAQTGVRIWVGTTEAQAGEVAWPR